MRQINVCYSEDSFYPPGNFFPSSCIVLIKTGVLQKIRYLEGCVKKAYVAISLFAIPLGKNSIKDKSFIYFLMDPHVNYTTFLFL